MGATKDDVVIPPTVTQVKVTNVVDPFHLRIYETETYAAKMLRLESKLHHLAKTKLQEYGGNLQPKIGDLVLIDNRNSLNVDLPAWCCRGVVASEKMVESKYRVFLPDHGIALEFWIEELKILPPRSISNEFLTSAVGINDLLPITLKNLLPCISAKWSDVAVKFTREIISGASSTYFDHLTSDKSGNKFGELYLILDGEIIALSKALVCNHFAVFLTDELQIHPVANYETLPQTTTLSKQNAETGSSSQKSDIEAKQNSDKSDDNREVVRSDAVYARAFNGSLKRSNYIDPNHEIVICGEVRCEQLHSVTDARFPRLIHKVLYSLPIRRLMRLQKYVWPAITKGLNVVAVASQKSGKTMSYIVPIVSSIAANETYVKIPGINGPLALILCVSSLEVYEIHDICMGLLSHFPMVKVLSAYNGISERSVVANIYNGCEILITTPPYLKRLIKKDRKLLDFSRLSHMVFDGADIILDKYQNTLREILKIPNAVDDARRDFPGAMPLQMIVIARHWTPSLKRLVNAFIKDPYVCMGSYMEAAVYAGLKPKLIFLSKSQKAAKVVELLDTRWSMVKTMIVCTTTLEATELVQILKSNSIDTLIVHNETIFIDIKGVRETWMSRVSGKYSVLVCTDQVLSDLNIKDVQWLIHYSLASDTKTQFFYRFSTLTHNVSRRGKVRSKPSFILMADESNDAQVNGIVNVMMRLEAKIPPTLQASLKKIFVSVEMNKTNRRMCENIRALGSCPKKESCPNRHIFVPDIDQPTTKIRPGDWVKLVLTGRHRHSANHYSARIVEYTTARTNEKVLFSFQEFAELSLKIHKHYANPSNRRSSKKVNVGNVCAIEESPGHYKRVQVLSAADKNMINTQNVDVRCIDDGEVFPVKACQLLEIPEDLAQLPSHIVDIYLIGIMPFDNEPAWSPCADEVVGKWFDENLAHSTSCVYAKVLLHLSHILWVDPIEVRHKLQDGYPDLVDSSLKTTLIEAKCAVENKEHIAKLLELCRLGNMETDLLTTVTPP